MKSPAEPDYAIALHDTLMEQIDIAKNTLDSILLGQHRFDALHSLSLQLLAVKATSTALKLVIPPSTISASAILQDIQAKLYEAADIQVTSIGVSFSHLLARLSGDTLAAHLAGKPNKKTLINLLGDIYAEIGVVHRLIILTQFSHRHLGVNSNKPTQLYVKGLCLNTIKSIKGG